MNPWAALAPLLKSLVDVVSKALLGLFILRQGEKNQQLADLQKEEQDAKDANKDHATIASMSNSELADILRGAKHPSKSD